MTSLFDRVENNDEKGENTGYQHFLLFTMFSKATVKPRYFESRSYESPGCFELYRKYRQKLQCIAPKIVWLFRVLKIRSRRSVPSIR